MNRLHSVTARSNPERAAWTATHPMQTSLLSGSGLVHLLPRYWIKRELATEGQVLFLELFWQLPRFSLPFARELDRPDDSAGAAGQRRLAPIGFLEHPS